jgi:dihydroxyacetone synthase
MFLYALNHLVGYDAWTMDELKGYGSAKSGGYTTICHQWSQWLEGSME